MFFWPIVPPFHSPFNPDPAIFKAFRTETSMALELQEKIVVLFFFTIWMHTTNYQLHRYGSGISSAGKATISAIAFSLPLIRDLSRKYTFRPTNPPVGYCPNLELLAAEVARTNEVLRSVARALRWEVAVSATAWSCLWAWVVLWAVLRVERS